MSYWVVRMELHCSRELALRLGAIEPLDVEHHRKLKNGATLLVRDPVLLCPLYWPMISNRQLTIGSSR